MWFRSLITAGRWDEWARVFGGRISVFVLSVGGDEGIVLMRDGFVCLVDCSEEVFEI